MPPYPVQGFAPSLHSRQTPGGVKPEGALFTDDCQGAGLQIHIENSARCHLETPEADSPMAKISAKVRDSLPGTTRTTCLVLAEVSLNKFTIVFEKGKSGGKKVFMPLVEMYLCKPLADQIVILKE
ncbi:MAG: hypothetical protein QMD05_02130 [Candidatus Brocadiaceae bacterium]|nr:hypothetical protein [Candidatus Brocadiaceae bacterium]